MTIKQFIKRKPRHTDVAIKRDSKKKRSRKKGKHDPWKWCPADEGLLKDNKVYMNVDTENMIVNNVTIEGEIVDYNMDLKKMKEQYEKWRNA